MAYLLFFILGIIFYGLIMPVLESMFSFFAMKFELRKARLAVTMQQLQEEAEGREATYAIGFDTSCCTCAEDDDDEEEEEEEE